MSDKNNLRESIEDALNAKNTAQEKFLRAAGWTFSCSNPSCCWLWEKTLSDGRTVLVSTETAIQMQDMMGDEE